MTTKGNLRRIAGSMNSACSMLLRMKPSTTAFRIAQAPWLSLAVISDSPTRRCFADFRHAREEFTHVGIGEDPGIAGVGGGHDADGVCLPRAQEPASRIRAGVADFAGNRRDMGTQRGAHALRPAEDVADRGLRNPRHLGDIEQGHCSRHSDLSLSACLRPRWQSPTKQRESSDVASPDRVTRDAILPVKEGRTVAMRRLADRPASSVSTGRSHLELNQRIGEQK